MIYVEFYNDAPLVILTKMTSEEYTEAVKVEDIRTFESLEVFSDQYPDFKVPAPRKDKSPQLRREAIKKADVLAAEMQKMIVGTPDKNRESRFKLNAEALIDTQKKELVTHKRLCFRCS